MVITIGKSLLYLSRQSQEYTHLYSFTNAYEIKYSGYDIYVCKYMTHTYIIHMVTHLNLCLYLHRCRHKNEIYV